MAWECRTDNRFLLSLVRSINVVVDELTSPNARDSLPRHLHVATVIFRSILTSLFQSESCRFIEARGRKMEVGK